MREIKLDEDKVAILMATYNGERFLQEQLNSLVNQIHKNWFLLASDDQSTDNTSSILKNFKSTHPQKNINLYTGPAKGFVENFLSVTRKANGLASYYAWCDQDDIWHSNKLEKAIAWIKNVPKDVPALYCGRTRLVSEKNEEIGFSPLFRKAPSFNNALTQNIGGGNTMVFNQTACELIINTTADMPVVCHDWWAYIIVTAVGGKVFYDPSPCLRYRQHDSNIIGANTTKAARLHRFQQLYKGRFKEWNDTNVAALVHSQEQLTTANQLVLQRFMRARQSLFPMNLIQLWRSRVYRQTRIDNIGLVVAATIGKI